VGSGEIRDRMRGGDRAKHGDIETQGLATIDNDRSVSTSNSAVSVPSAVPSSVSVSLSPSSTNTDPRLNLDLRPLTALLIGDPCISYSSARVVLVPLDENCGIEYA